jgi:hypothetical protein
MLIVIFLRIVNCIDGRNTMASNAFSQVRALRPGSSLMFRIKSAWILRVSRQSDVICVADRRLGSFVG